MSLLLEDLVSDYGDPFGEALACRTDCALFDFSFVRRARVSGPRAISVIEAFQPRSVAGMDCGQICYSVTTDCTGGVGSDLTIWRHSQDVFDVMSGHPDDPSLLEAHQSEGAVVENLSWDTAITSIQGPSSLRVLEGLTDTNQLSKLPYFQFTEIELGDINCLVGRLGYTGERGFEIIVGGADKAALWALLSERARPAGFAAVDILRIEAGFMLFLNECRIRPTVDDLGLGHLLGSSPSASRLRFTGFTANTERRPVLWQPRSKIVDAPSGGAIAITSACYSPHFQKIIGLGFVGNSHHEQSANDPTGEFHRISVHPQPLYDPQKLIPRSPW